MAADPPAPGIAIIGMGEVGCALARVLAVAPGASVELCDPRPQAAARALARELDRRIHRVPGSWLNGCGVVLSVVPGEMAEVVADTLAPLLRPGTWYIDMTTAAPDLLAALAVRLRARGVPVTDVAIMGAVALTGARTPLLLAGPDAGQVRSWLVAHGLRCSVLAAAAVGDASALKLVRSIFTKGLEALAVDCLVAAEVRGLRLQLLEQLAVLDETPIAEYLNILVTSHVVHASRRLVEVETARAGMQALGLRSPVLDGVIERFRETVALRRQHPPREAAGHEPVAALEWLRTSLAGPGPGAMYAGGGETT